MNDAVFFVLAALLLAFALGVVTSRNLYRAAYSLAGALLTTAMLYLALTSPLLAAVQILLYTGGVLTLVVFALVITGQPQDSGGWRRPLPALVLSALVFVAIASQLRGLDLGTPIAPLDDGKAAGIDLFSRYIVPFELLSVLLLGAIFGALAIARHDEEA